MHKNNCLPHADWKSECGDCCRYGNVPDSLLGEYYDSHLMQDIFAHCDVKGKSQVEALVYCVKALHHHNKELMSDSMKLNDVRRMLDFFNETNYLMKLPILKEIVK